LVGLFQDRAKQEYLLLAGKMTSNLRESADQKNKAGMGQKSQQEN
jgi:hypothetical protein